MLIKMKQLILEIVLVCNIWILFCSGSSSFHYYKPDSSACNIRDKYRTIDGVCNNLYNPEWGSTEIPFLRFVPPAYEAGATSAPRDMSVTGKPLPGPRVISSSINNDTEEQSPVYTFMHMTFGQLLDHDITKTKGNSEDCGAKNCDHVGECLPIQVPDEDADFPSNSCIKFVRSFGDSQGTGHREQVNEITSYIDAGFVYGDDVDTVNFLRDTSNPKRGRLVTTPHPDASMKPLLPKYADPNCQGNNATYQCFKAGDVRANAQMGLTALHTIFHRAHNSIEEELHSLNPHWGGERLYQEARRIIIAAVQQISYSEYLPLLLGSQAMSQYGLELTKKKKYWKGYDASVNPGIMNQFAAASFRFGHTQIGNFIRFQDAFMNKYTDKILSFETFHPYSLYTSESMGSGVDCLLRGSVSLPADKTDVHMSNQMTAHLFTHSPPYGVSSDLAARNIQRGRDHGLPGYISFRRQCNLTGDLSDIPPAEQARLLSIYDDEADIDLWVGGLAETHVADAMVGPTFVCLIGQQFKSLRAGDRFWFETKDRYLRLKKRQLKQIRKFSLAYLMCAHGDDIQEVQPKVMIQPKSKVSWAFRNTNPALMDFLYPDGEDNEYIQCSELLNDQHAPKMRKWKTKRRSQYYSG